MYVYIYVYIYTVYIHTYDHICAERETLYESILYDIEDMI